MHLAPRVGAEDVGDQSDGRVVRLVEAARDVGRGVAGFLVAGAASALSRAAAAVRSCEGVQLVVEAIFNGVVIARSANTVVVEGNHYFPPDAVVPGHLVRSWARSLCPWKGLASYYTVEVEGERARNAAWTYRHPSPLARKIKNHVAFWGSVMVVDESARERQ